MDRENLFFDKLTPMDTARAVETFIYNLTLGDVKEIINGQRRDPYAKFLYGYNEVASNGCGVIAVHNALRLMSLESQFRDVIFYHEMYSPIALGLFGTNPLDSRGLFAWKNVTVTTNYRASDFDLVLKNSDIVILTYNNSDKLTDGVHTVAIKKSGDGILVYNYGGNDPNPKEFNSIAAMLNGEGDPIVLLGLKK
jgi:hypothetical protein